MLMPKRDLVSTLVVQPLALLGIPQALYLAQRTGITYLSSYVFCTAQKAEVGTH